MIKSDYIIDYIIGLFNDKQIENLNNFVYKEKDSCFYDEILSYDSIIINHSTVSTRYNRKNIGSLLIFERKI